MTLSAARVVALSVAVLPALEVCVCATCVIVIAVTRISQTLLDAYYVWSAAMSAQTDAAAAAAPASVASAIASRGVARYAIAVQSVTLYLAYEGGGT
jgi:hypothetical protein